MRLPACADSLSGRVADSTHHRELLETLVRLPSELDTASFRQIWSYDELAAVGELFGTWLRLARHRGTVANLHPCYTRSAGALLAAGKEWPEVGRLPELWLDVRRNRGFQSNGQR